MKDFLRGILEVVDNDEEVKDLINMSTSAIDKLVPMIKPQLERVQDYAVDCTARMIKRLETNHGFSKDQSIQIVGNMITGIKNYGARK